MPRIPIEKAEEQYKKLPAGLKDAIFSADIADKILASGRKNGLTLEETGILGEETGYVILGLTHPEEFMSTLVRELKLEEDEAGNISHEINQEIFLPLRELFRKTHNFEIAKESPGGGKKEEITVPAAGPETVKEEKELTKPPLEKEIISIRSNTRPVKEEKASSPASFLAKIPQATEPFAPHPPREPEHTAKIELRDPGKIIPVIPRSIILYSPQPEEKALPPKEPPLEKESLQKPPSETLKYDSYRESIE